MMFLARLKLPRKQADNRVLTLAGYLAVSLLFLHILVFFIYRHAMWTLDEERESYASTLELQPLRGDPSTAQLSSQQIDHPCEFDLKLGCASGTASEAVLALEKQQLPLQTRQLVSAHGYPSAYDVVEALLAKGDDTEAVMLLDNPVFDKASDADGLGADPILLATIHRADFANKWYLTPAFMYVSHNREYDAIVLFKNYLHIMEHPVNQGSWLSLPGLDATDLAALAQTFCDQRDTLQRDECLLSILRIAAPNRDHLTDSNLGGDDNSSDDHADTVSGTSLVQAFDALPSYLQIPAMGQYLAVWAWDGSSLPEPVKPVLSPAQSSAWSYALAIRLLSPKPGIPGCELRVSRSRETLAAVASDAQSIFSGPAERRVRFIDVNRAKLCQGPLKEE